MAAQSDMMAHAAHMLQSLGTMSVIVQVVSIMMGLGLFMGGMFTLKRYGEMRTFMSHQMTLWAPMAMIIAGATLLVLESTISTSLLAFWGQGNTSPLAYAGSTSHNIDAYVPVINAFVRLIGVCAIIRACMLFSRSGAQGSQPGTIGKAVLHLLGGVLCIHIIGTARLVMYIFDINQ